MELFLVRHAEAIDLGEQGITRDEDRPLTVKGEEQARSAAKALAARGIAFDKLYASPLVRARQTAEIMLTVWARPELTLETCEELTPGTKPRKLSKFLLKSGGERVGLVGHMPLLAEFTGWLLGDKDIQIEFAKAGIALVTCGDFPGKGMGNVHWVITPEWY